MHINEALLKKYIVRTTEQKNNVGWSYLLCEVLCDGEKIGEYTRNYSTFFNTFHPFRKGGKDYALYSRHYTATRVMSLPDCKDLGGEDPDGFGFCPAGFAVPYGDYIRRKKGTQGEYENVDFDAEFGFVCGCVWGDDSGGWKIGYLDLSKVAEGIVERDHRFGHLEMWGDSANLHEMIDIDDWDPEDPRVALAVRQTFWTNRVVGATKENT